jgi:Septum formation
MTRRVPRVLLLGVGIVVVAGIAVIVWLGASTRSPANLLVGDCFDVPTAAERIEDIRPRPCGGPHGGEAFHIYDATLPGTTYPADATWEATIYPVCDPAFEAYTGTAVGDRLDIEYLFLVPTANRWTAGDRRVTCFITSLDGSPLSRSHRAAP